MGCSSSKRIEATVDVYRPPPSSFAVFDINSIQEPWLAVANAAQEQQEKKTNVPASILEKLSTFETDTPHSWDEVSKALEDLKPTLTSNNNLPATASGKTNNTLNSQTKVSINIEKRQAPSKSFSFHTVEELDAKLSVSKQPEKELRKTESTRLQLKKTDVRNSETRVPPESGSVIKPVKENIFILRDRLEREKEGKTAIITKRDPLSEYPEKCPPGGANSVVVYTTSLRGVRRTHEDCNRVRAILEGLGVVYDERDVSLHGEYLNELKELVGEGAFVPRVFVKGRYIGGMEEVNELNESGRLRKILNSARVEMGVGSWQACEGCGGARFIPCLDCGGSCKVVADGGVKERCARCNENGLVRCPACL